MTIAAPALLALPPFLQRWHDSGAAERANYQLFLSELCDQLGVPRPDPTRPDDEQNAYVFERAPLASLGQAWEVETGRFAA